MPGTRTRANMPGVNSAFGLENVARPRIVPGRALDHVVDEVHVAAVLEIGFVDQPQRRRSTLPSRPVTSLPPPENARSADTTPSSKVNSKRIGSVETMVASSVVLPRGAAGDEVARRHAAVADAAGDRRAQLGELQIELGLTHGAPPAPATVAAAASWPIACAGRTSAR